MHGGVETELACAACGAKQRCGPSQLMQRLVEIGMLKRSADPDLELLSELLRGAADRLPCPACAAVGLTVARCPAEGDLWGPAEGDLWDDVRLCDGCRQPISPERLEVFPDTTRCPTCQLSSEDGGDLEREFCDHCGSVLTMRIRRSAGPAAYEMHCPSCRR